MATKIKVRRDTKENWETYDPVLADGELAYCKTTKRLKIGDGVKKFSELPQAVSNDEGYSEDEETLTGKRWIDGKPIYRKVCKLPSINGDGGWHSYNYLNPPSNVETLVNGHIIFRFGTNDYRILSADRNSGSWNRWWEIRSYNIGLGCGSDIAPKVWRVVLEYTKTTD